MARQFTNYAENKIADWVRAQGITLPTNWCMALGSAADEASFTELTGTGYARVQVPRSLTAWAGTQGAGSTLASNGVSHASSNNAAISWGNPGSAWGTAAFVGFFDQLTGGNCWVYLPIPVPIVIASGSPNPVQMVAGALAFSIGISGGLSDYLSNAFIDLFWRGQPFTFPTTMYFAAYSSSTTNAGGGTELSVAAYSRVALVPSLTSLSATQSVGSTSASSGTLGRISNNAALSFPAPGTTDWPTVTNVAFKDAATAGNTLFHGALALPRTIVASGPALSFAPNTIGFTFD